MFLIFLSKAALLSANQTQDFFPCILVIFLIRSRCVTAPGAWATLFSLDDKIYNNERLTKYERTDERQ